MKQDVTLLTLVIPNVDTTTGTNGVSEREPHLVIPLQMVYPMLDETVTQKLGIALNIQIEQEQHVYSSSYF